MHELSRAFLFEAAHTLQRDIGTEGSRRIHGHSYRATITLAGVPDPVTGMLIDIGHLDTLLADTRDALDHRFLDEVPAWVPPPSRTCAASCGPGSPPACRSFAG
jgi:6-pyruvoyltetrahydropterin/6-carboxytetrahydropterin synthase